MTKVKLLIKKIVFVLFICIRTLSYAQFTYPKQNKAEIVLKSTLIVELLEGKSEHIINLNNSLKEVFENYWKDTALRFMTTSEIKQFLAENENGYAILYQEDYQYSESRKGSIDSNGRFSFGMQGNQSVNYTAFTFSSYCFFLNIRIDCVNQYVTSIGFGNDDLSKVDHLFVVQQLKLLLDAATSGKKSKHYLNVKSNIEYLKSTTLILPKSMFMTKDIHKIDDYYKFNYELVDEQTFQDIILNKTNGKTYPKIIWSTQHKMYMWIVVDATNGAIRSVNSFGGFHFGKNQSAKQVIKAKYLKYATSKLAQKVNNRYGWKIF